MNPHGADARTGHPKKEGAFSSTPRTTCAVMRCAHKACVCRAYIGTPRRPPSAAQGVIWVVRRKPLLVYPRRMEGYGPFFFVRQLGIPWVWLSAGGGGDRAGRR